MTDRVASMRPWHDSPGWQTETTRKNLNLSRDCTLAQFPCQADSRNANGTPDAKPPVDYRKIRRRGKCVDLENSTGGG